jgi:hypothetical protein
MPVSQFHAFASPHPASVPVDPQAIRPTASRELYLLRLRAETFRIELELESQLRLQGIATLPLEWTTYLELQRRLVLEKIQWIETMGNDFSSLNDPLPAHVPVQAVQVHPFIHPENEGTLAVALIW